jgi:hypothetical protein
MNRMRCQPELVQRIERQARTMRRQALRRLAARLLRRVAAALAAAMRIDQSEARR